VISLLPLARDHSLRGEHGPAIAALERAVALSSELGTEDHLYLSRARLARERRRDGDLDGALRDIQATHRRARELGHRRMEVNILVGLANVHRLSGDLERADRILDELAAAQGGRPGTCSSAPAWRIGSPWATPSRPGSCCPRPSAR
jgi:hypothetical protein